MVVQLPGLKGVTLGFGPSSSRLHSIALSGPLSGVPIAKTERSGATQRSRLPLPFFALWAKAEQPDRRATDSKTRIRVSPSISITSPQLPFHWGRAA